jgi:hypothetical protein
VSRAPEVRVSPTLHKLPFREAFLSGLPDHLGTVLRALGRWMSDQLVEQGLMDPPSDPRTLLRWLHRDLLAVELGLAQIIRFVESKPGRQDADLLAAARRLNVEVRDLASRIQAVSDASASTASSLPSEVAS